MFHSSNGQEGYWPASGVMARKHHGFSRGLGDHAWSITALRRYGPDWGRVGWMELLMLFWDGCNSGSNRGWVDVRVFIQGPTRLCYQASGDAARFGGVEGHLARLLVADRIRQQLS